MKVEEVVESRLVLKLVLRRVSDFKEGKVIVKYWFRL